MRYEVTLRGPRGASETVTVEADSGDDAAAMAFKPYTIVSSVQPAAEVEDVRSLLRAQYESVTGKKPFNGWNDEQLRERIFAHTVEAAN